MDIPKRVNISSFRKNIERSPRIPLTKSIMMKWTHPIQGQITEILCLDHFGLVAESLSLLGIGYVAKSNDLEPCLRCTYDGFDVRKWLFNG